MHKQTFHDEANEHEQDGSIGLKDFKKSEEETVMNLFDEGLSHEARITTIKHSIDNIFKVTEKSGYSIESENEWHDKLKDDAASVNFKQDDEEKRL